MTKEPRSCGENGCAYSKRQNLAISRVLALAVITGGLDVMTADGLVQVCRLSPRCHAYIINATPEAYR